MSEDERRTSDRVEAIVVVALEDKGHGVTRNVSGKGLLIATRSRFSPGDRLELMVYASSGTVATNAVVVRVDETPPEEAWRYRVALQLDKPLPESIIHDGAESAARLLGPPSSRPPPSR